MESKFKILGFTCGSCATLAKKRIERIDGVKEARVDLDGETTIFADRKIDKETVRKVLEDTHYSVQ